MHRLRLGIIGMDHRQTAILVHTGSTSAVERSARTLDRRERRSVEQTARGEQARVAKQAAPTREVKWLASEIGRTSPGYSLNLCWRASVRSDPLSIRFVVPLAP